MRVTVDVKAGQIILVNGWVAASLQDGWIFGFVGEKCGV